MKDLKPLKRFGQNFLKDPNIIRKIAGEIDPKPDDNIIEIGPGLGAMTEELYKVCPGMIAVEIDKRSIEALKEKFPGLHILNKDFLEVDLKTFAESNSSKENKLRITGNIPYNITSPVLFKMILNNELISDSVLMVQYEVAKRITAERGTKDYGILTVLLNYFCETRFCFRVSPNVFFPRPNVFSAVIHLFFKKIIMNSTDKQIFINVVKASFGKRRKTLKNSLSSSIFADIDFSHSGADLSLRAEQLTPDDFIRLAEFIKKTGVRIF